MGFRGKGWLTAIFLVILGILIFFFNWNFLLPPFLTFSDAAKFADIARNLVLGRGYGLSFANFGIKLPELNNGLFNAYFVPPLQPLFLFFSFKILGMKDFIVIFTSGIFYSAGVIALFYLGKKIFGELIGFLTALAFIFDPAMLNYATSGASESLFIFEIILSALFFFMNSTKTLFLGFLTLIALYFTRRSAMIYIVSFILFFILLRYKKRVQILKICGLVIFIWFLTEVVLMKFSGKLLLYSSLASFLHGIVNFSPTAASTTYLRGGGVAMVSGLKPLLSKIFYNFYNFYKLLPQILSPYLAGFYILSLFRWEKERELRVFRFIVFLMVAMTFFASAAFLPIYRYLHPVVPFVYLLAIETLVFCVKIITSHTPLLQRIGVGKIAFLLVFIFVIGQTLGKIFLDSRYIRAHTNPGKPPVYVKLSWILKENTSSDDLVITNLDTWGSWYGERKTIWYPLEPSQLIPEEGKELKIDAIYLTSYKMDDENYYMGENWRKIFYQPEKLEEPFFAQNFKLAGKFEIKPEETYEKEGATAILLTRRK